MTLDKELNLITHIFDIIKLIFFIGLLSFLIVYGMLNNISIGYIIIILIIDIVCSGFLGILIYQLKDFKKNWHNKNLSFNFKKTWQLLFCVV